MSISRVINVIVLLAVRSSLLTTNAERQDSEI